jgi:hypothetical protein
MKRQRVYNVRRSLSQPHDHLCNDDEQATVGADQQ